MQTSNGHDNEMDRTGEVWRQDLNDHLFRDALVRALDYPEVRQALKRALQTEAEDGSMVPGREQQNPVMSIPNVASLGMDARALSCFKRVDIGLRDSYQRILEVEHPAWIKGFGRLTFLNTVRALRDANIPFEVIFDSSFWQTTSDSWRSHCLGVLDRSGLLRSSSTG